MKVDFKKAIPYVTAIAIFFAISIAYFSPSIFQGKTLYQGDVRKGYAAGVDLAEYKERTGETSLWASRMFSGMPSYQITPSYKNSDIQSPLRRTFEGWLPSPANHLFAYMLGFFLLLLALRVNPWIAIVGSIAFAFSTYYLIIIMAGHIWKVRVLTLIPPTMAGIVWAYRGKLLAGGVVTALFFSLQLFSNHLQMTYYFLMFVGVFLVGRFIYDYKEKQLKRFARATAVLLIAGIIGFAANSTNLIFTHKYTSQTTRGGSELTANAEDKTGGLERSYVTAWSYGIGETFTLLIPNAKGGATSAIGTTYPDALKNADPRMAETIAGSNAYWGDQAYTAGPVYAGALIIFLFVLGLFIVKGYLKWVLLVGTVFSILLSWGSNFMWLTNIFLDYFPYYNKMRAVSSILVIAQFCIPILAVLALVKVVEKPTIIKEKKNIFYLSIGLTAGLILLFIVAPKLFFSFLNKYETAAFAEYIKENPLYATLRDSLESVRISIFRADAWRSFFIIMVGVAFIWLYSRKKISQVVFIIAIGCIVLIDLFLVNKRYLNKDNFVPKSMAEVMWEKTPADAMILEDQDPNFRVLNLSVSPFNDGSTSYYHKSIGGYHGAKLRRYQDIIDHYLIIDPSGNHRISPSVLNMLNTKYLITSPSGEPHYNPDAFGNAWFVENIEWVSNADEEIAALGNADLTRTAVIDRRFEAQLGKAVPELDSMATIYLDSYEINHITYKASSEKEQLAVFSEIYYDDGLSRWEAFIDGQPIPIVRANYLLRAIRIPAGEHTVEFVFKPKAYGKLEMVSVAFSVLILLSLVALPVVYYFKGKRKDKNQNIEKQG